jgi:uncharacterized phage protein (TIGR01671 family)
MKNIKFRAWVPVSKGMVSVDLISFSQKRFESITKGNYMTTTYCCPLSKCDLMISMGRKDSKGKEIYEGDIVTMEGDKRHYTIGFDGLGFVLKDGYDPKGYAIYDAELPTMTVIGNMYENPELTEDKRND